MVRVHTSNTHCYERGLTRSPAWYMYTLVTSTHCYERGLMRSPVWYVYTLAIHIVMREGTIMPAIVCTEESM